MCDMELGHEGAKIIPTMVKWRGATTLFQPHDEVIHVAGYSPAMQHYKPCTVNSGY